MMEAKKGFATRAIHEGQALDAADGRAECSDLPDVDLSAQRNWKNKGYEYSRLTNPTRDALEECLCSLEGGTSAHCFGSGMAAITALCTMMKAGEHVVCALNVYGGTQRVFDQVPRELWDPVHLMWI